MAVLELRVVQDLLHGAIGRRRDGALLQGGKDVLRRQRARPILELVHELDPVRAAIQVLLEAWVGDPVHAAGSFRDALECALARNGDMDVAVLGRDRAEHMALGRRRDLELSRLDLGQCQRQHALEHRDVDVLALAGGIALVERRHDCAEGVRAGQDVGDVDAAVFRLRPAGLIGHVGHVVARSGVDHRGVGRKLGRRAGLAVARDRAVDKARVDLFELGVGEAQPPGNARAVILDENVGLGRESTHGLRRDRILEVEHYGALAGIELAEARGGVGSQGWPRAHHVALGALDLDDVGAEVGEQARAMRSRDRRGQIDDLQSGQCLPLHVASVSLRTRQPRFRVSRRRCKPERRCPSRERAARRYKS